MQNILTSLFLIMLILTTGVQFWLLFRHLKNVEKHRSKVPTDFANKITLEEHQKAADYTLAKGKFSHIELLIAVPILLLWLFGGGLQYLDQFWRTMDWGNFNTGVAVIVSFAVIGSLIDLPASLYRTFVIENKFGFNKSSLGLFFMDKLKGMVIAWAIGVPLIYLMLYLIETTGDYWWIYGWGVITLISLIMMWAYPKFIAPLFNKFESLEKGDVRKRIESLLSRTGFNSKGVFVMDGSKRSSHGNAYFSGFGKNKRIVFFDTLLKHLTPAQIEAVLAHELGHFKRKHIVKGMILSMTMMLMGFAMLAWLMGQLWFYNGLGFEMQEISSYSTYIAILLFLLVSSTFTFFISPIMSWWSRKHEFEADEFAAKNSSASELISALVSLYRENANTLTPDPLYSAFYDSHPPASIRIAHLKQA